MSVEMMTAVYNSDLDKNQKAIALALADVGDNEGKGIYPSVARIAWQTGYSERQVQRILKRLKNDEIVVSEGRSHLGTNIYFLDVSKLPKRPSFAEYRAAQNEQIEGGDILSPYRVTSTTEKGDMVSPDPLDNHIYIDGDSDEERQALIAALSQVCQGYPNLFIGEECEFWQTAEILQMNGFTVQDVKDFEGWWTANGSYPGKPALKSLRTKIEQAKTGFVPAPAKGKGFIDQWSQVMDWLSDKIAFANLPAQVQSVIKMCGGPRYFRSMQENQIGFYQDLFSWAYRIYLNGNNGSIQDRFFLLALKAHYDKGETAGVFTESVTPYNLKDSYQRYGSYFQNQRIAANLK